jgi:hypothetical protein
MTVLTWQAQYGLRSNPYPWGAEIVLVVRGYARRFGFTKLANNSLLARCIS